jgi:hypothetical protein
VRKHVLVIASLALAFASARATQVVYDPIVHGTIVGDQVVNFAKWAASEAHEAQTQLNTLQTYENTVLQVARMGNPAALRSLPGVSNVAELYQIYGQLTSDYQQIQRMTNPQNLQMTFNSILSTYKQPTWNGFTAANGVTVQPNQGSFQFATSNYNVAANVQQQLTQLDQKKQTLTQERDAALQSLQSATDQSSVQKLHSSVTALNGAIADINQSEQQLFNQARLQQTQNVAAQQIYQAAQREATQASDYQAIDQGLNGLPLGNLSQPVLWNQNP